MRSPFLIIGGSGGIGAALARILTTRGEAVVLAGRNQERLAQVAAALTDASTVRVDVTDTADLTRSIKQVAGQNGLSGLAYAVGSIVLKPLRRATATDFAQAFALNAIGAAMSVQAAEPALREAKGTVVLFSTIAAQAGFPNHSVIATAKGGVEALARSLAADMAPDVRVNCVAPSLTKTPLAEPLTSNEAMAEQIAAMHPLPRLGEPEDIAATAAFLLGAESGWITGQVFAVDGGRSTVRHKA